MNAIIVILILAVAIGGYLLYMKYFKKEKGAAEPDVVDTGPIRPGPVRPRPPYPGEGDGTNAQKAEPSPTDETLGPPEKNIPKADPKPIKKQAPVGWFYNGVGTLLRNLDPNGLWLFEVARRTQRIDFKSLSRGILPMQDLGNVRLAFLTDSAFQLPDEDFTVTIAQDARFNTSVVYLCDKDGNVIDFTISAEGRSGAEKAIEHKKGMIPGGPYMVQASNGVTSGSSYMRPRSVGRGK